MMRRFFAWVGKRERHLSATAMVAGFAVDTAAFERTDVLLAQGVLLTYLVVAAISIAYLHALVCSPARAERETFRRRARMFLPILTQFMLGGAWSAYLIFFSRSAVIGASWPFLLVLGGVFLGNEVCKKYHERLAFTATLLYFALFSYFIFSVPILLRRIGSDVFLIAGGASLLIFGAYLLLLRLLGAERFKRSRRAILTSVVAVFGILNLFYFANILPPLPLALKDIGVYHRVTRVAVGYVVSGESSPWYIALGFPAVEHVRAGDSLSVFSSVFAPTALTTSIVHRWSRYDSATQTWNTQAIIAYPITGGVDGGYRGFSTKSALAQGAWRVDVETARGALIGRVRFDVETATTAPALATETK